MPNADASIAPAGASRAVWLQRVSWVLWPSFLMAGVMEAMVFAVLDPSDMTWWGQSPIDWPRSAVYTVSFFIFWLLCSVSSSLSLFLALSPPADPVSEAGARSESR